MYAPCSTDHDFWLARGDDAGEPKRPQHPDDGMPVVRTTRTTAELIALYGPVPGMTGLAA